MKKIFSVLCAAAMLLSLAACGSDNSSGSAGGAASGSGEDGAWVWERDIEMVCTFDVGSGTDTTLRAIQSALEQRLGVSVVINNVSGASGVNGAEYFAQQPADGYTYAMYTPSHLIAAVNGTTSFDIYSKTMPVTQLVWDSNVIYIDPKLGITNLAELKEYATAHPGELTLTLQSVTGIDAVSAQNLFDTMGIEVTLVASDGAEAYSMVMGGHASMTLGSPADGLEYLNSGLLGVISVLAEQRNASMPDVETSVENGYDCTIGPWRMIVAMEGTPDGAIESLAAAFADIEANDTAWDDWKVTAGLADRDGFLDRTGSQKQWTEYRDYIADVIGG